MGFSSNGPAPATRGGGSGAAPATDGSDRKNNPGNGTSAGGYGSSAYGANASTEHIRSFPEGGLAPTDDGTLQYPSDVQLEAAANKSSLAGFDAATTLKKHDNSDKMYDIADADIRANTEAIERQQMQRANSDWQARQQRQMASLDAIANNSGTGQSGSYWDNVMQAYALVDDMADVAAINNTKKALNQAYMDEAEALQQNRNARNENDIATEAALDALVSDYAGQLSSINPSLVSGVFGSPLNKTTDENTPEEDRPSRFPYLSQSDIEAGLTTEIGEDASPEAQLANKNSQNERYDFSPIVDRENHTVIAPAWWPAFQFTPREQITPRQAGMVRGGDEVTATAMLGNTGETYKGSSASKVNDLAPYIVGYQNRK